MNKKYRLKKNYDIEKLVKARLSVGNMYFVIYYGESEITTPRFAFSVSKKLGNAVVRNKEKRALREILRCNSSIVIDLDYLIIEKSKALSLSYQEKEKQITYLLRKIIKQRRK